MIVVFGLQMMGILKLKFLMSSKQLGNGKKIRWLAWFIYPWIGNWGGLDAMCGARTFLDTCFGRVVRIIVPRDRAVSGIYVGSWNSILAHFAACYFLSIDG
ncbi:hypothetical protein AOU00_08000 [Paenibacillus polymyxa]|nr:hypothetical protein AOU00_08000 [Paenibacillus polymyxa]